MRFELGIFDPTDDWASPLPAVEWLDLVRDRRAAWVPDVGRCTLFLEVDGIERIAQKWDLGALDAIVDQLEAAGQRLRRWEMALLRSAVDERPGVPLFLMRPLGSTTLAITTIFLPPTDPHWRYYPVERGTLGEQLLLYPYVQKHEAKLTYYDEDDLVDPAVFADLRVPVDAFLAALDEAVEVGRTVLDVCARD